MMGFTTQGDGDSGQLLPKSNDGRRFSWKGPFSQFFFAMLSGDPRSYWTKFLLKVKERATARLKQGESLERGYDPIFDEKRLSKVFPETAKDVIKSMSIAESDFILSHYVVFLMSVITSRTPFNIDLSWYSSFSEFFNVVNHGFFAKLSKIVALSSVKARYGEGIGAWRKHFSVSPDGDALTDYDEFVR